MPTWVFRTPPAPQGADLYAAPKPVTPWEGVREATSLGATAPQPGYDPPFNKLLSNPIVDGPDFLNLNVWTPGDSTAGGGGLPVLVWFHGGAFRNGSNANAAYDGTAFARDGVVLVSVNYRLGVAGFGVLEGAPSNRGLLDQLAALAWVQENIAAFGGDPSQVTIFGQSAGGMSVATLLSLPSSKGLFRRAIMQSGSAESVALATDAMSMTAELAKHLGIQATPEALGAVLIPDLIAAQQAVSTDLRQNPDPARFGASVIKAGGGIMPFFPVVDGELIHEVPLDAINAGAGRDVELMVGTTTEEFRFFTIPSGIAAAVTAEALPVLLARAGLDPAIAGLYAANRPGQSPGEIYTAVTSDASFTVPTLRLAEAASSAYVYEFAWQSPLPGLGACHALEIPFVFDTLADGGSPLQGDNPPQELADRMHAAWVAFATTGDPGWSQYDTTSRPVMSFDHPESRQLADPHADELALLRQ
ncbi:carboxylesterase/lipase family protein [Kribbella qitaiheensis]|uniref:carboxylesterase/lipase family protein n=1 Tax=Kribbella qitaiheensis TaxID=1544730 RepID=UPI0019D6311B|nr:carboxylesterase family protein [Kribbella qitaiheensis]